ncbi:MAG: DUF2157 domain-containing protein, partial [Chromatiales bacterium]
SRAAELAGLTVSRDAWLRQIDRFLLSLGTLLIVSGIAAFFAWNWADLGHLTKFALIETGLVAAAALSWYFGIESLAGKATLLATALLTGVLLAVFGQIYQTGADPYELFLTWSLLILPWTVIGRQAGLWIVLQLLLNLTLILYYTQVLHPPSGWWQLTQLLGPLVWLSSTVMDSTLASYLFALNLLALVVWEYASSRSIDWLQGRLFPRLFAFIALCTVLLPTLVIIVAASFEEQTGLSTASPLLLFLATAGALYYYQFRRHDLLILTCALFGAILVLTTFFIRHLGIDTGGLLLIAFLIIAQVAGGAWWLRRIAQSWEAET